MKTAIASRSAATNPFAYVLSALLCAGFAAPASADCMILPPQEPATFTVKECRMIDPQTEPVLRNFVERWVRSFTAHQDEYRREAEAIAETYRGAVLTVEIDGRERQLFDRGRKDLCPRFDSLPTMTAFIHRACCDGDPNVPCLLDIEEYIDSEKEADR